ncbi:Aldose 1-epimerase precursor [Crateriforma conspicua]|uniref:Aldose 1-epimerase n=1 Tax=Crateriforma conspicua TaxID=2527996 RepID=A0A5C6FMT7_9PLAN|nr:aldose epimerase family protein [Crateriforma conspicua]TWU64472.1 Aldose 1-epimerase precursor [Crateriforma conspicua]
MKYTIGKGSSIEVDVVPLGAIITAIRVPDASGAMADVVLGFNDVSNYTDAVDHPYFGAVVGRYGNRIAKGEFQLNGQTYRLACNNGSNHLHGGDVGFDRKEWTVVSSDDNQMVLQLESPDGDEGYPGNLIVTVTYKVSAPGDLEVLYEATTDQATPVNLTQHTYFNLGGEGSGDILDHELKLNASQFVPVDPTLIPTGQLADVADTPFDFRQAKPISRDILSSHPQLEIGQGFDHNFIISKDSSNQQSISLAASVKHPTSGRTLEVWTDQPGVQFYSGNFLDGRLTGKSGSAYTRNSGFCLETQHFPDSPNQIGFPSTILYPDSQYKTKTIFRFGF